MIKWNNGRQTAEMVKDRRSSPLQNSPYHLGVVSIQLAELPTGMMSAHYMYLCPEWRGPCLVADCGGWFVHFVNNAAYHALRAYPELTIKNGVVQFIDPNLHAAFARACDLTGDRGQAVSAFAFRSTNGGQTVVLHCRLLPAEPAGLNNPGLENGYALSRPVLIEIRGGPQQPDPASFAALCIHNGLSPTESLDLKLLVTGMTLENIARERGVSLSTVRQNLKKILGKMHCSRQIELARLVFSACPASWAMSGE